MTALVQVEAVLTAEECDLLLESLSYTKRAFQDYADYPSYEFKMERIAEVDHIAAKLRMMRIAAKNNRREING